MSPVSIVTVKSLLSCAIIRSRVELTAAQLYLGSHLGHGIPPSCSHTAHLPVGNQVPHGIVLLESARHPKLLLVLL